MSCSSSLIDVADPLALDTSVLINLHACKYGDHGEVRNLGDVRWKATEDGSTGKGTGRHIACFILRRKVRAERG